MSYLRKSDFIKMNLHVSPNKIAYILDKPNPTKEQYAVITAPLKPNLIIAGAGAGKTETITARVLWLIVNKIVKPSEILGVTFTRKASTELSNRIMKNLTLLKESGLFSAEKCSFDLPYITTYHSYAQKLILEYGIHVGIEEKNIEPIDSIEQWRTINQLINKSNTLNLLNRASSNIYKDITKFSNQCSENLIKPKNIVKFLKKEINYFSSLPLDKNEKSTCINVQSNKFISYLYQRLYTAKLAQKYEYQKSKRNIIDLNDLIKIAIKIVGRTHIASLNQQNQFKVVLLDEFQDTSYAQLMLFSKLFGNNHPITAVGDPNQSIYAWRGASINNIKHFNKVFIDVDIYELTLSWRNKKNILNAANVIISHLKKESFTTNKLYSLNQPSKGYVKKAKFLTYVEESQFIAKFIQYHLKSSKNKTIAILCRKKSYYPIIEKSLINLNIAYEISETFKHLFQTPEILDLISMLKVIHGVNFEYALIRILMGPRWQIGPRDLRELKLLSNKLSSEITIYSLLDTIDTIRAVVSYKEIVDVYMSKMSYEGYFRFKKLAKELFFLRKMQICLNLFEFINCVIKKIFLDIEVSITSKQVNKSQTYYLDQFLEITQNFCKRNDYSTLDNFLSWLDIAKIQDLDIDVNHVVRKQSDNLVNITTIHSSKGLEWDIVIVPRLEEDFFPSKPSSVDWVSDHGSVPWPLRPDKEYFPEWNTSLFEYKKDYIDFYNRHYKENANKQHYEEERRLAYVAFTRAKEILLLTSSVYSEKVKKQTTSRFIDELDLNHKNILSWVKESDISSKNPLLLDSKKLSIEWPSYFLEQRKNIKTDCLSIVKDNVNYLSKDNNSFEDIEINKIYEKYLTIKQQYNNTKNIILPNRISVSHLIQLFANPYKFLENMRRPIPMKPNKEAHIGKIFHEWVENFYRTSNQILPNVFNTLSYEKIDVLKISKLIKNFEKSRWAKMNVAEIELPIALSLNMLTITGRIDAVFINKDKHIIIDWKTGLIPQNKDLKIQSLQLAIYKLAYSLYRNIKIDNVKSYFYFSNFNQEVKVDQEITIKELERKIFNYIDN